MSDENEEDTEQQDTADESETPTLVTDEHAASASENHTDSHVSESPPENKGSEAQDDQPEATAFDRWTEELKEIPAAERAAAFKRYFDSLPEEEQKQLPWNVEQRERSERDQSQYSQLGQQQQQEVRLQGHRAQAGQAFKKITDHLDEVEGDEERLKKTDRNLIETAVAEYGEAAAQVNFNDQLVSIGTTIVNKLEQFGRFNDETRQALVAQTSGKGMEARFGLYLDELIKRARAAEAADGEKVTSKAVAEALLAERGAIRNQLLQELKIEPQMDGASDGKAGAKIIDRDQLSKMTPQDIAALDQKLVDEAMAAS